MSVKQINNKELRIIIYTRCVGNQRVKELFVNELYSQPAVWTIAAKQNISKVLVYRVMFDAVLYIQSLQWLCAYFEDWKSVLRLLFL